MPKTGKFPIRAALLLAGALLLPGVRARAGEVKFTAQLDREQISQDDSVSLKMNIAVDGATRIAEPQFTAPDFEVVNQYNGTYVESYYDSNTGQFGIRNNQQLTKVLRPLKTGDLKITGIHVSAGGQTYTAPDVVVHVRAAGAATPPPRGYGGSGVGLRGSSKHGPVTNVFLRAEIDKEKVFKGEQIIVSYYVYSRVRLFNFSLDKFPVFEGFLSEDVEMPVMGQHLDKERVILDGVPYERSLLLRYAVYPLKDGKLRIDTISAKYNFFTERAGINDDEDPFMNFFQQMAPHAGNGQSTSLNVEVMPLPEDGRPQSFTGGVGDFSVVSAADKLDVRANEAVTVTVKVEGKGNVAAIGEPKVKWPDSVELYDTKGRAKTGKGGVGDKIFEFLLIPRTPGKLSLPPMEFGFFDPARKTFYTKKSEPIEVNVLEPAPGSALSLPTKRSAPSNSASAPNPGGAADLRTLKGPEDGGPGWRGLPVWRWLYWAFSGVLIVFAGLVLWDLLKKGKRLAHFRREAASQAPSKTWEKLRTFARNTEGAAWQEVVESYERLTGLLFDAVDDQYGVGARALSRTALRQILVDERGMNEELWSRTEKILEFAELVRFASSAGAVSESGARKDLARWVAEGEAVVREIPAR
ncbi:MAG: BatD family protein [Bdellovibrionota bacterium]